MSLGIRTILKNRALGLTQKALERLMADETRAGAVANAVGTVQRGKRALDRSQDEVMRALSFAPKSDLKALGKRLSLLKKRLRALDAKATRLRELPDRR